MKEETRGVEKAIEVYSFNQLLDQQLTTLTESATGYTPQHNPLIFQRTNAPNFQLNTKPPQQVSYSTLSTTPVLSRQYIVNRPSLTIYLSPSNLGCSNFTGSIVCITNESATPVYTSSVTQWNESGTAERTSPSLAQTAHWSYDQVTLNPVASYCNCHLEGCSDIVEESIVFISDDHKHDNNVVQHFKTAVNHLLAKESCIVIHSNVKESDIDEALSDFLRHAPHQAGGLKNIKKEKELNYNTTAIKKDKKKKKEQQGQLLDYFSLIFKLTALHKKSNTAVDMGDDFRAVRLAKPVPSLKTYRGSDVLREIKGIVCLKQPEAFTFTALKNHITTLTQLYEMDNTMQDLLAQFLGHDIRVHRKFYWLPLDIIQEAKVSKFLIDGSEGKKQDFVNLHIRKMLRFRINSGFNIPFYIAGNWSTTIFFTHNPFE
ncbi:unnamed protein product [Mytilus coruscus]|uniref:Uncharacterized protein n=1 Tax=Mytilus coruscus TaxID=42192 RepID=A0A6J8DUD8_MYTCO|nr:unnamed protein product [Mytilus coruscus]